MHGLDSTGRFSLQLREGRNYVIQVRAYEPGTRKVSASQRSAVIPVRVRTAPLHFVLPR